MELELGRPHELELHQTGGHTPDGAAYWFGWLNVLVCGDYLSPAEIPMLNPGGSISAYLATLDRLGDLVALADWVISGHGAPMAGERALEILSEDRAYLEALERVGADAPLPRLRASATQKRIHESNLEFVGR
jgi:glyoxylase-like metal-dependent hydrolase (beta-lactamase superfamily II)